MSEKRFSISYILHSLKDVQLMIFVLSLDSRNTKKLKTKMLSYHKQKMYFCQIVSKKAMITILLFMRITKKCFVLKEVTKDPIVRGKFAHCPAQDLLRKRSENMNFTQPEQTLVVVPDEDEVEGL